MGGSDVCVGVCVCVSHVAVLLSDQQDLDALHVQAPVQQVHGLVQVVLTSQRDGQLRDTCTRPRAPSASRSLATRCRLRHYLVIHVVQVQLLPKDRLHLLLDVLKLHRSPKHQDPAPKTGRL